MSQTVTLNGVSYTVPEENDNNWGGYTTTYLVAIASNMLQKNGGAFNLTADVDFGSTYGLIAGYFKSASSNIASAGVLRLSNTDDIAFRNIANSGDLLLSADASTDGILNFNSVALVTVSATQTLTNKTLTSPTLTSPVLNTSVSGSAIDTDLTSVSASDDTLASAKAIKTYVDAQVTAADLDFQGDSGGAQSVDLDSQSLTIEGGTGVDTTGSAQKISIAIDSTVTTNSGSQTLTNKTIDVDNNTVSNIEVDNLKAGVLDTDLSTVAATDTTIPSAKATKTQLDTKQATIDSSNRLNANLVGDGTVSDTEYGYINSLTSNAQTQLDAKQATIDSSNRLNADLVGDGSVSNTEFGYINSVTSNVQTQIDAKQATITGAATTITSADLTASRVVQSNASGKVEASSVTTTTLGYLDATSSIQTQLDAKAPSSSASLTSPTVTDFIELDHQGSDPSAPSGSGDARIFAKDGKVYKIDDAGSVNEVGSGGAGDAYTIHLKSAEASDPVNTAPWYTGNNPVPGGGGTIGGTWELSTSNPLINIDDKTKVFHYSNGTSNRKNDYFEIELDIPNYAKGKNLVVSLFYRTVGAEDTDFLFFSRDRSADYETTTTSSGSLNTITLASATGFAVGDRICIQDTSDARHFRYVTAVSGSDITFGGDAVTVGSGDVVVSKYFTDELDYITAENNTTNYEGKIRKWAFQINDATTKIRVGFIYDNSATSTNELFFDQILLSSNQFLQTSSRGESEEYRANGPMAFGSSSTKMGYFSTVNLEHTTLDKTGFITNSSSDGWSFEAKAKCSVVVGVAEQDGGSGYAMGVVKNPTESQKDATIADNFNTNMTMEQIVAYTIDASGGSYTTHGVQSGSAILEKGDKLYINGQTNWTSGNNDVEPTIILTVTPEVSDCVLLSSQDEIFTDWTEYTPTLSGTTSNTNVMFKWRRVAGNMEIRGRFEIGSTDSNDAYWTLPSGYAIDTTGLQSSISSFGAYQYIDDNFYITDNSRSGRCVWDGTNTDRLRYGFLATNITGIYSLMNGSSTFGSGGGRYVTINASIPIAGWSSTFNPVLSMPLQDFSSLENTFSARIANDGTASIVTQTGPFISSVSKTATGEVTVTFVSGFFGGVTPGVVATCTDRDGRETTTKSLSASSVIVTVTDGGTQENNNFTMLVTRQGSDYRQAPQATAAVIKPAVAIGKVQLPTNTAGGTSASDGYNQRKFNTWYGETWFISGFDGTLGTNGTTDQFDLDPGMYKVSGSTISYKTDASFTLMDSTDSSVVIEGVRCYPSSGVNCTAENPFSGVFTITEKKTFKIWTYTYDQETTYGLGVATNQGTRPEVYGQVIIEKLK